MTINWLLPVGLVAQALNRQEVIRTEKIFLNIKINAGSFYNSRYFNVSFYLELKNVAMKPVIGARANPSDRLDISFRENTAMIRMITA
jgi:hypothetical protein